MWNYLIPYISVAKSRQYSIYILSNFSGGYIQYEIMDLHLWWCCCCCCCCLWMNALERLFAIECCILLIYCVNWSTVICWFLKYRLWKIKETVNDLESSTIVVLFNDNLIEFSVSSLPKKKKQKSITTHNVDHQYSANVAHTPRKGFSVSIQLHLTQ